MIFESKQAIAAYFWDYPDLQSLDIAGHSGITSLPRLPNSLSCLNLRDFPDLENLPSLPNSLHILLICNCPKLTKLPVLPGELRRLDITCCPEIMRNGGILLGELRVLAGNCLLRWGDLKINLVQELPGSK